MSTPHKRLTAPTLQKIRKLFQEHLKARSLAEKARHHQDSYRDLLRDEYLPTYGTEDSSGNYWILFPEDPIRTPDGGLIYGMKAQKTQRVTFDEEAALALIKAKGLEKQCVTKVVTYEVDEDALLGLAFGPDAPITDEEIQSLYVQGEPTYSFVQVKKPTTLDQIS